MLSPPISHGLMGCPPYLRGRPRTSQDLLGPESLGSAGPPLAGAYWRLLAPAGAYWILRAPASAY